MTTLRDADGLSHLGCDSCGKSVSSPFVPVPTDTPDKGLIIRAYIECPECLEQRDPKRYQQQPPLDLDAGRDADG